MVSLENYLENIYRDLETDISHQGCLGQIKNLNYKDGNIPNYNNKNIQQFYLLKYAYAYTYEYYIIYEQALRQLGKIENMEILSIGCGAFIDYNALKSIPQMQGKQVDYTGVDKVNWNYKPLVQNGDKVQLKLGDGIAYFQSLEKLSADIYMFPKSICEFSFEEIEKIADCFVRKNNVKDKFCICISLRNTSGRREEDLDKARILEHKILAKGYIPSKENSNYYAYTQYKGINAYVRDYKYPNEVLEGLPGIGEKCKTRNYCACFRQCESCFRRSPILKTGEICYKVMTFERSKAA